MIIIESKIRDANNVTISIPKCNNVFCQTINALFDSTFSLVLINPLCSFLKKYQITSYLSKYQVQNYAQLSRISLTPKQYI